MIHISDIHLMSFRCRDYSYPAVLFCCFTRGKAIWMRFDRQDSWQEIALPKRREIARQLIENGLSKNQAAMTIYQRSYGGNLVEKF